MKRNTPNDFVKWLNNWKQTIKVEEGIPLGLDDPKKVWELLFNNKNLSTIQVYEDTLHVFTNPLSVDYEYEFCKYTPATEENGWEEILLKSKTLHMTGKVGPYVLMIPSTYRDIDRIKLGHVDKKGKTMNTRRHVIHPHWMGDDDGFCYGDFALPLQKESKRGNFPQFINSLVMFVQQSIGTEANQDEIMNNFIKYYGKEIQKEKI